MDPRVSVIIPAYNAEPFVADAVNSILCQGYPNLEIIVVDDGSTDGTVSALGAFGDAVVVIRQENRGQAAARNAGIRRATGTLIGFLDADDLWTDHHIASMLPYLRDDQFEYVRGYAQYVRAVGTPQEERSEKIYLAPLVASCLYKKSLIDAVGPFDESMRRGEDFDWHVRIAEHGGREKKIEEVAMLYRRHDTNITNSRDAFANGLLAAVRNQLRRSRAQSHDGS